MSKKKFKFKNARPKFIPERTFDYIDDYGEVMVSLTLRFLDHGNSIVAAAYKELAEEAPAKAARTAKLSAAAQKIEADRDAEKHVRAFIDACVINWVNLDEETGDSIPYSADDCYEFFTMDGNQDVFVKVLHFCQERADWILPKDVAKN